MVGSLPLAIQLPPPRPVLTRRPQIRSETALCGRQIVENNHLPTFSSRFAAMLSLCDVSIILWDDNNCSRWCRCFDLLLRLQLHSVQHFLLTQSLQRETVPAATTLREDKWCLRFGPCFSQLPLFPSSQRVGMSITKLLARADFFTKQPSMRGNNFSRCQVSGVSGFGRRAESCPRQVATCVVV